MLGMIPNNREFIQDGVEGVNFHPLNLFCNQQLLKVNLLSLFIGLFGGIDASENPQLEQYSKGWLREYGVIVWMVSCRAQSALSWD